MFSQAFTPLSLLHLACFILFSVGVEGLKDLRVSVPNAIRKGETAVFLCDFDLEDDQVYAVKWYKGRKEFYRYTPKDEYPIKTFHLDNIYVDKGKSNMTQLTLLRVSPPLSGIYNCEVSAESPSFHTILASGEMTVVDIAKQEATIEGLKQRYRVSESLEVVCTAGASKPPANITWFINGDKAYSQFLRPLAPVGDSWEQNLMRSRSQLSFLVNSHSFRNGLLTIRCTTTVLNMHESSVELRAREASAIDPEIVVFVSNLDGDSDFSSSSPSIAGAAEWICAALTTALAFSSLRC